MTYRPFPEHELRRLAEECESTAAQCGPKLKELYQGRAEMLRAAIGEHEALRTRFLEQSMRVRELEALKVA